MRLEEILRPYQVEVVQKIDQRLYELGEDATIAHMATGMGKTHTFLGWVAEQFQEQRATRILVIAHTKELIHQPAARVREYFSHLLPVPGIVMAEHDEWRSRIVVATVQTLSASDCKRLRKVLAAGSFSHVVIDECHHATASTYVRVIQTIKAANPGVKVLGVTATPKRSDGEGLGKIFKSVAARYTIADAIRMKALVPFVALGVQLPISLDGVSRTAAGEYNDEEVGERYMMATDAGNPEEIIIETWREQAGERPTIAFTASVKQAHSLAASFREAGIKAEAVDGTTKAEERDRIVRDFQEGRIQVVMNCAVFTEGFDAPHTSCVIMAKPTKSDNVYVQCVGRGLRTHPTKKDCLILDFMPFTEERDFRMAADLAGKPKAQRKAEAKAKAKGVILDIFGIDEEGEGIDADPDTVKLKILDFLGGSKLAWTFAKGCATVSVGKCEMVAIVMPQNDRVEKAEAIKARGEWREVWDRELEKVSSFQVYRIVNNRALELIGRESSWELASYLAQEWAEQNAEPHFAKRNREWRNTPPRDKQIRFGQQLKVYQEGMDSGQLSQAISHKLAILALAKNEIIRRDEPLQIERGEAA